jgi:3',5'-cyclic AMP phosphodiesterase CpdA
MRLWAISDLHLGHKANREALAQLPNHGHDWIILGGDVGETEEHLELALSTFSRRFARVIWVPGNHELWTVRSKGGESLRGEAKYERLVALCHRWGALTPEDPYPLWAGEGGPRLIVPLFVLYDYSFRPDEVPEQGAVAWAEETGVLCTDEHLLHPDPHPSIPAWCAARVAYTEARLAALDPAVPLVLVNHFPLDERLLQLEFLPRFSIWCGTRKTRDWHLRHRVDTVVYGHMHKRRVDMLDGVRFEEVSLGYPRDWAQEEGMEAYLHPILPAPARAWEEPPGWSPPSPPPEWLLAAAQKGSKQS